MRDHSPVPAYDLMMLGLATDLAQKNFKKLHNARQSIFFINMQLWHFFVYCIYVYIMRMVSSIVPDLFSLFMVLFQTFNLV